MSDNFYCKEWDNVGYTCEDGQCDACARIDATPPGYENLALRIAAYFIIGCLVATTLLAIYNHINHIA